MRIIRFFLLITIAVAAPAPAADTVSLSERYRETVGRIIGAAMVDEDGWGKLTHLCYRIGHRLSGSPQLEQAIDWAGEQMRADGFENVREIPVMVPHWVRGRESASMVAPWEKSLPMLGLGDSVGTPPEGITAEVVVVNSFEQLSRLGVEKIKGKIVLYNVPFQDRVDIFRGYQQTVVYRSRGASQAARLGAVAALVRSVTPRSLQTPHTGALQYVGDYPRIPGAALTVEDAEMIDTLVASGESVRVLLKMEAQTLPDVESANVMGEIRGSELPEEVVVVGGHFDSWDVGQGAQDDGAACIASMQALALIRQLGLRPRRTLRAVLFTNEENGMRGGRAYRDWAGESVERHVAAIEMDGGSESPVGFGLGVSPRRDGRTEVVNHALRRAREIGELLEGIGAGDISLGGGGADIQPLMQHGVPGFGLRTIAKDYFDWHHTEADTLDKVNKEDFRKNIAALAVLSFVLADMPERLVDESQPATLGQ